MCAAGAGLDAHTPVWASHPPAGPGLVCPRALPPSSPTLQSGKRGERPCLPKKKNGERDWVGEREKKKRHFPPPSQKKRCANAKTKNKKGNEFLSGEVVAGRLVCTRRAESGEVLRGEV